MDRIQVLLKSDKSSGYFMCIPMYILIIYRPVIVRMRNVSGKICIENRNTHFIFCNFFLKEILPFVRRCWKI